MDHTEKRKIREGIKEDKIKQFLILINLKANFVYGNNKKCIG